MSIMLFSSRNSLEFNLGVFFVFWKAATKQNKRLHFPWFESGFFTVATEELTLSISIL
jgi:hypothetical protein